MGISNAIVIGAGIGGLAAAAALARRGMAVTVLEQSPRIAEVGAGLQISPNGLAVLRALGLESTLVQRGAVRGRAVILRDETCAEVAHIDLERLGADQRYFFVHRADLIDLLAGAARRANVSLELGAEVARIEPGPLPELTMADGSRRRAELIVDASGIHARGRALLNGADTPVFSGQVAWRALVPNQFNHLDAAQITMGPGRHLVSYPLRGGRLINLVAVEEREGWAAEGWNHNDDPAHLQAAFAGFGGQAGEMIAAVDRVTLWGLHLHPVAQVWQQGGVTLLGDAAHPTLPFLAQGANMALEDAWVLADCVLRLPSDEALPAYQAAREARARRVIRAAEGNARKYHLRPGLARWAAHAGLRLASKLAPGRVVGAFDWLYRHDVTKRA